MKDADFVALLEALRTRSLPTEQIGPAIVKLGKPFNAERIRASKEIVASFLNHPDSWVRHEALWFLGSWGKLPEYRSAIIDALLHDPDADVRGFAALCLTHLLKGNPEADAIGALKQVVENTSEATLTRLDAYGALMELEGKGDWLDFIASERTLADIDWNWVRSVKVTDSKNNSLG